MVDAQLERLLLKSLIVEPGARTGAERPDLVAANHAAYAARPTTWTIPEDAVLYRIMRDRFDRHGEPPDSMAVQSALRMRSYFGDLTDRLTVVPNTQGFLARLSFEVRLDEIHEGQASANLIDLAKNLA